MGDKIFIGATKSIDTQYGQKIKLALNINDLAILLGFAAKSGKVAIVAHKSKAGKWYSEIDTWKPAPAPLPQGTTDAPPIAEDARFNDTLDAFFPCGSDLGNSPF